MKQIEDVRRFWDANPLFTGVGDLQPGTLEFFEEHKRTVLRMNGGKMHDAFLPVCAADAPVLSLGCGIGFWIPWYAERGFRNLSAADLSANSLALAKRRSELYGVDAAFSVQNAESMTFENGTFDHADCTGVIHHSPNPQAAIDELFRVLRPGGRAVVSVYYVNFLHRIWPSIRPAAMLVSKLGYRMSGRGREMMLNATTTDELVRLYDGASNPIGVAFSRPTFERMFDRWQIVRTFYTAFPTQLLPANLPDATVRALIRAVPFMIGVVAEKPRY